MKNLKRKVLKALSLVIGSFILVLIFFTGGFILGESYNIIDPYADTEMAPDYTPEKFKLVKEGMTIKEVKNVVGEPLHSFFDSSKAVITHNYTRDGYLRRRADMKFSLVSDLAWYGSTVEYNMDSVVTKVYSRWYYD